ncbi:hypothetical protein [Luteimicrobium subarcticum]|uniref:LppX_LprAFG lipoprotein n=1 Tax=Luteimicrobium subarcticum TaxID=620910 RepID=A0A2M8WJ70_9MICO|nr:hypothetical protein [Luteimicrobium subarcticum]PJI90980.1 hypothetical protein CLV34_2239 [Luteimicrobium subarcticum]
MPNVRRTHRVALLAPVVALAAASVLAGCGSSDDDAQAAQPAAGSLTAANFVDRVTAAQQKVESERMVVTATSGGNDISVTTDLVRKGDGYDFAMTLKYPEMDGWDVRYLDSTYYIDMGSLSSDKFLKYDPKDPGALGELGSTFTSLGKQADPTASVSAFQGAVQSLDAQGGPDADGVQEYVLVADTSKVSGVIGDQIKQAGASASLPTTLTYHFWVDGEDRVRKTTTDIGSTTSTVEFSKIGEKVTVEKPSDDDLTTADKLGTAG